MSEFDFTGFTLRDAVQLAHDRTVLTGERFHFKANGAGNATGVFQKNEEEQE